MSTSIKKTSLFLFSLRIAKMLLTVLTVTFMAKYFGVSIEKDMWVLAYTFITTINLAIWGPINETFRTKFVFIKEQKGAHVALSQTSSLIGFVFVVSICIVLLLFAMSSPITNYLTKEMPSSSRKIFMLLFLLLSPTLIINEITNICISVLNAYEVYYLPEVVGSISAVVNLGAIIVFAPFLGIYSLMIANYFGAVLLLVVVLFFLSKNKIYIWRKLFYFKWRDVKIFIFFALPFFFPYFVGQMNGIMEKYLSGLLGGGMISSLDYSRQFISVLQSVISSVLTTLVVPLLAKSFINGHSNETTKIIKDSLVVTSLIVCAASIFLLGLTEPVCRFFFYRGKVSLDALNMIIMLTRSYGMAFWGVITYLVFGYALLASGQGKYYATIGVLNQILILLINITLVPQLGLIVFPVSYGLIHLLSGCLMFLRLKVENRFSIAITLLKSMIISMVLSYTYYNFNNAISIENNFLKLLFMFGTLLISMPFIVMSLGVDLKSCLKKII